MVLVTLILSFFLHPQENNPLVFNTSTQTIILSTQPILSTETKEIEKVIDDIKSKIFELSDLDLIKALKILEDAKEKIIAIKEKKYTRQPIDALIEVRKALISYYTKTNRYPSTLDELVPEFIPSIPEIKVHSEFNSSVKYIRTNKFDRDYTKAVDSSTEYIYFADPKSIYWGFLIINSTQEINGIPYYKY